MIQRAALTAERERQISAVTPDIWYDTLAGVAAQMQTSPQNSTLKNQWRTLLHTIEAEDLAQEPLSGSVIPLERETTTPNP